MKAGPLRRPGWHEPRSSCKILPTALRASRRWRKNSGCILSTSHERFAGHSDAHPPNIGCAVVLERQWGFSTIAHLHYRSYLSEQVSSTRVTLRGPFEIISESPPTRIEKIFENARVRFNSYKYLSNQNAIMASGALS